MALRLEEIRALADRVALSHGLSVVDVEYQGGGGRHRTLRVFIEKNEVERAKLRERVSALEAQAEARSTSELVEAGSQDLGEDEQSHVVDGRASGIAGPDVGGEAGLAGEERFPEEARQDAGFEEDADLEQSYVDQGEEEAFLAGLPSVANLEFLSGITHGDCEAFSRDFGTVLDVEELVPGTEYLLEVSSPGLDRRLSAAADYRRFAGSLVKLQTFEPVSGNRHWQGRILELAGETVVLDAKGGPERKKPKKGSVAAPSRVEIQLGNVEKAHLVPEF